MRKWGRLLYFLGLIAMIGIAFVIVNIKGPEYAYIPPAEKILNRERNPLLTKTNQPGETVYDVWGMRVKKGDITHPIQLRSVSPSLSPENGAIPITDDFLTLGRQMFYAETFGNEVFLTDIMGIVDGPFTIPNLMKAIVGLRGKGTTNLRVELAKEVTIGGKTYKKGEKIDTGIDVPKGAYAPLGMPVKFSEGRLKVGISCAACHATVDEQTKTVIEGAPNQDLNAGLLMALAPNSTAYFTHTDVKGLTNYLSKGKTGSTTQGSPVRLPDAKKLEEAVDAALVKWPPGNFDSTIDMENNPAQIPDSFTFEGHPYGWSGFAMAGPFKGLSAFSNNVHAQNADSLAQSEASSALFGIGKELYLGTLLQNAANPKYRYDSGSGLRPSQFFAKVDPTPGVPGVNELIKPPTFPKLSLIAPDGLFAGSKGYKVGEQVNSMAAWQNTILPPPARVILDQESVRLGERVFRRANCMECHTGEAYTNHRIISSRSIGTEPSRAKALKKTESIFSEAALFYAPNTPIPIPRDAVMVQVPTDHLDREQMKLAFAHGGSPGGYKVKGLVGLYWTAPYLHDGGVAVGKDEGTQLGVSGTLMKGIMPDPFNSLKALVDKKLREKVVAANRRSNALQETHVQGIGHEFWVDETTGFTKEEQDALIKYLLSLGFSSKHP